MKALWILLIGLWGFSAHANPSWQFSLSLENPPKYKTGFSYFDYATPDSPQGGAVRLAAIGSFDSVNPFILKGNPVTGIGFTLDSLMTRSLDESSVQYPLIAEKLRHPEDFSWVEFAIDPRATFSNGQPITPRHIQESFSLLRDKGRPFFRYYYKNVSNITVTGPQTIRFEFNEKNNRELPFIVSQLPIFFTDSFQERAFDESSLIPLITSGPYMVSDVDVGKQITYQRRRDYWADQTASRKGLHHIDQIRVEYFRDPAVAFEAFKTGVYDYHTENQAKRWATGYDFPRFLKGDVVRQSVPLAGVKPMQGFVFNTRRSKFSDPLVRQALARMFDFAWLNKNLFFDQYFRTKSYFQGSELAARGLPEGQELALLEPFADQLPKGIFTSPVIIPGEEQGGYQRRRQLRMALSELKKAGWSLNNGRLINAEGEPFTLEFLINNADSERVVAPFVNNLGDLGIEARIRMVDAAQYEKRLEEFDFDMVSAGFAQSTSPGNEQRDFWSRDAANRPGSRNLMGVSDPVVDSLVDAIIFAEDRQALIAACRALDRVLLWGHYLVPNWYFPGERIAYDAKLDHPEPFPSHDIGFPEIWWVKP